MSLLDPKLSWICGEGSSIFEDEPAVEAPGEVPTVVVDEEDSSVEFVVSGKETMTDQAEGTGAPVPEDAQMMEEGLGVRTGEPVLGDDRSGEVPDLMEVSRLQGLNLIWDQGRVIFDLKISLATNSRRWENSLLRNHLKPHLFLAPNGLQNHPRALSRGRRWSRLLRGERISHGSASSKPSELRPLYLHPNHLPLTLQGSPTG